MLGEQGFGAKAIIATYLPPNSPDLNPLYNHFTIVIQSPRPFQS